LARAAVTPSRMLVVIGFIGRSKAQMQAYPL
jgi:hypothetical protein